MDKIFALVDCDNFYASCERVFNPAMVNRPIVVLSNNDGCVIARSSEAKSLDIPFGSPYFKIEKLLKKHNVAVFSSNYELYGDMSRRVMEILSGFALDIEVYSIDEAFLELEGFRRHDIKAYVRHIREYVLRGTGIPVTIGVGPSKTLAKVAGRHAKKNRETFNGVCSLVDHPNIDRILEQVPVEDVWGVGRQHNKFLHSHQINTARQLKYAPDKWVKKHMTVVGLRTVLELRGDSCLPLEQAPPAKKAICTSRSFGHAVTTLQDMREAVAEYASRAAVKLRKQHSAARIVQVFLMTYEHSKDPYYSNHKQVVMPSPTSDTLEIVKYACLAVERIFREGYRYKKAAIFLFDIVPDSAIQNDLFDPYPHRDKSQALMQVLDGVNTRYGAGTLQVAAAGTCKGWAMQRNFKSNNFTTNWDEIPVVKAKP